MSGVIFALSMAFTVVALESYRQWIARGPRPERRKQVLAAGASLGLVFLAMLVGGAADWLLSGKIAFLNLAFFLIGTIGLSLLAEQIIAFATSNDHEMRRVAARDL